MRRKALLVSALVLTMAAGIPRTPAGGTVPDGTGRGPISELTGSGLWDVMACSACLAGFGATFVPGWGHMLLAVVSLGDSWLPGKCVEVCIATL